VVAKENLVEFVATNLEIAISTSIEANVISTGKITLPSRLIVNYVSLLKDGEIDVSLLSDESVKIVSRDSETKIKGLSAEEFPEIPSFSSDIEFSISGAILKKAIERVAFACSASSARPVLSGVLFWINGDELRMVGTDSYRLSEQIIELSENLGESKYIVPARTLQELSRIITNDSEVKIEISKNQILFSTDNTEIFSRLIEGNFPDYKKIIPLDKKGAFTVSRSDLILAVKRAGIFAREMDNNIIKIELNDDGLKITTDETEIGSGNTFVEGKMEGDGEIVALNSVYFLDVLQVLHSENIRLVVKEQLTPFKVLSEEDDGFTYILMPLKV
jgi:DNA polymerase-3 subunit beta